MRTYNLYRQSIENSKKSIHVVAVLPFTVTIDSKRLPKGMTIEILKESEEKTGADVQNNAYTWFLQKQKKYSIAFQDIDKTNALLKQSNITYDNMTAKDKGDLCKLLGVDAVISGKIVMSKPMSEGVAAALLLVGGGGITNQTTATLSIHDTSSVLLWKFDHKINGSLGSSSESVTDQLMKKCSKKFPFKNDKETFYTDLDYTDTDLDYTEEN